MKFFINEAGEVFAFELALNAPKELSAISEEEALALVALPTSTSDLGAHERMWRGTELSMLFWIRERHYDQREIEVTTTLSEGQFKELLVYMQALRDWPQSPDFPNSEHRPIAPSWIADQVE